MSGGQQATHDALIAVLTSMTEQLLRLEMLLVSQGEEMASQRAAISGILEIAMKEQEEPKEPNRYGR